MPKKTRNISDYLFPEAVRYLATPSNYRLGEEIANCGGVEFIQDTPNTKVARVKTERSQRRTVEFQSIGENLTWKCTCTKKDTFCKHCVAVAIVSWRKSQN